jgi:hypothetical protein
MAQNNFSTTVSVNSNLYADYVKAASTAVGLLSDDINFSLQKMRSTQ